VWNSNQIDPKREILEQILKEDIVWKIC